jgi:hypothetical protein
MINVDRNGFLHDAPVNEAGDESSDNKFFYTAIGIKNGMSLTFDKHHTTYCAYHRVRHMPPTHRPYVPISRDEILGLVELGYGKDLFYKNDKFQGWNFSPYPLPRLNPLLILKQANDCIESYRPFKLKHRNTFWKQGYSQMYHLAFSVPLSDRDYINQKLGRFRNPIYRFIAWLDKRKRSDNRSSRNIQNFKYGGDIGAIHNYFHEGHDLREHLKSRGL